MAKKLSSFARDTLQESQNITRDLEKWLKGVQFKLESRGKKNATADFYQPLTRSGNVREYSLTGRLRNSINSRVKRSRDGVEVILQAGGLSGGGSVHYAHFLEFGTGRIKPGYFFLGRAVQAEQRSIKKDLQKFLKIEIKDLA